jgi:hypothetical protein
MRRLRNTRAGRFCFAAFMAIMLAGILTVSSGTDSSGMHLTVPFEEIAQTADLVFIGTVENQECRFNVARTMIFTDVTFGNIEIIASTKRSMQKASPTIHLAYAGGELDGQGIEVSGTPRFKTGSRYFLFVVDDGTTYSTPIVGGPQGHFEVIRDSAGGEYLLTPGKKVILSAGPDGLEMSARRTLSVRDGLPVFENTARLSSFYHAAPPVPVGRHMSAQNSRANQGIVNSKALKLQDFIDYVRNVALKAELKEKLIKPADTQGKFYRRVDGNMVTEDLALSTPKQGQLPGISTRLPEGNEKSLAGPAGTVGAGSVGGGDMGYCGYHTLPLVMEQLPAAWPEFLINDYCMTTWNYFMDIYRFQYSDGTVSKGNLQNEFCGYFDEATLSAGWGYSWGTTTIAMCVSRFYTQCGRIIESDVIWNSAYSWTHDEEFAIGNSSVVLLRPVNMHELGHTWGAMRGPYDETYDYDVPTVMQGYNFNVVENGVGIHPVDAWMMRTVYNSQTGVPGTRDVGVRSYYASNGLHNSSVNKGYFMPGESMVLSKVTVENMSSSAVSDVRLRFYLSADRTITTSDYLVGGYFTWGSFGSTSYNEGNYTLPIPSGIPSGEYYVGAIVTINGFQTDDYPWNNSTSFRYQVTVGPSAPVNLKASDGTFTQRVLVSWDYSGDIDTYNVWRNDTNDFSTAAQIASGLTSTTYIDNNTIPFKYYYYWVTGTNQYGTSAQSNSDSGYRKMSAPTGVSATDGTYNDKVAITWSNVPGANTYEVWRHTSNSSGAATRIGNGVLATSFEDVNALPKVTYYYWVKSRNAYASSLFSSVDTGYRGLPAPTGIEASFQTYVDRIRVKWNAVPGATGYEVWRSSTYNSGTATKIASPTATTYDDTTTTPLKDYFYWVKSKAAAGTSNFSSGDWGKCALAAPASFTATDGTYTNKVRLTWARVAGATAYKVYRADAATSPLVYDQVGAATVGTSRTGTVVYDDSLPCGTTLYAYKVRASNTYGDSGYSNADNGNTGGCPPFVLTSPNGKETIGAGTIFPIVFQNTSGVATVKCFYSAASKPFWQPCTMSPVAANLWAVPVVNSKTCSIKIEGYDAKNKLVKSDVSDGFFTITSVDLTYPDGDVSLTPDDYVTITWVTYATNAPVNKVQIKLSADGGKTWQDVGETGGAETGFRWLVPAVNSRACLIKVTLKDDRGGTLGEDVSRYPFRIGYSMKTTQSQKALVPLK